MRQFVLTRRTAFTWLALLLVTSLLYAQSLGFLHSIAHAGWPETSSSSYTAQRDAALFDYDDRTDDSLSGQSHHHHSCAAFDEATLAASVHIAVVTLAVMPGKHVLALWQAFSSWDAPFVCHFSSRAPPR